ncbi:MAG: hypothetical protein OEM32_04415 [Acidimicrobiia bacterium]|nr:hypothetical protein [Acidimicrobiia bacterium]
MKYLAWVLFGIAALILVLSIPFSLQYWDIYGTPNSFSEWWSDSWWVLAVAAVPAVAGFLILRIERDRSKP